MDIYGNKLVNSITSPHIGITDLSGVCLWCGSLICPACVCLSASHTSPHRSLCPASDLIIPAQRCCGSVRLSVRGPCECDRVYTVAYFFVKLGRHVNHDERMHPIDFGGQRSKVKVTMDIYGNKLVNTIET